MLPRDRSCIGNSISNWNAGTAPRTSIGVPPSEPSAKALHTRCSNNGNAASVGSRESLRSPWDLEQWKGCGSNMGTTLRCTTARKHRCALCANDFPRRPSSLGSAHHRDPGQVRHHHHTGVRVHAVVPRAREFPARCKVEPGRRWPPRAVKRFLRHREARVFWGWLRTPSDLARSASDAGLRVESAYRVGVNGSTIVLSKRWRLLDTRPTLHDESVLLVLSVAS